MKASDLFIQCLEQEGVERIFGIPGEENLDLLESIRKSSIKLILTRHEQAAGFMAATYGRLTGKTGVCLSTLGPGATNFMTAVAYAQLGGMPVLFITGQKPIKKSKQGRFQILDVVSMMDPLTKFTKQIVDANNIPHLVRECFRLAESEKPGAVHLELPEDIAAEVVDRHPFAIHEINPPLAQVKDIQKAAAMIHQAKRPLICLASGCNRRQTHLAIDEFIEKTGLYFFNTQMGKGVVDERHPHFLGTAALSADDYLHCAIDRADLILNVGHDVSEKPPFFMHENGTQVIHLGFFPAQMDDVYFPQHEVVGCLISNLRALSEVIEPSSDWDFSYYDRVKAEIGQHIFEKNHEKSFPNIPQRIVSDVREALPSDSILSLDNGMYKIWFARNYLAHRPNSILLDNALATMGAGLPAGIGAKLVHPEKPVVVICGDGGFMMNSQELETAVRLELDLIILILNDQAYGMIKWKQLGGDFQNFGLDFTNPNFVDYAQSYGAQGHRVQKTGEIVPLIQSAMKSGGVHVIDVPVDYSENEKVFLKELKSKTCLI